MRNIMVIAAREFKHRVRSRGFILGSLAWPAFFLLIWALTAIFGPGDAGAAPETGTEEAQAATELEEIRTGFVDQSGLLSPENTPLPAYPNTRTADEALGTGEIEAYYLIPPDFIVNGDILWVSPRLPSGPVSTAPISALLTDAIIEQAGIEQVERFMVPLGPTGVRFVSLVEEDRPTSPGFIAFAPFLVTLFIVMPLFTSGDYLVRSVTQEKSSRVMEILLLSVQPKQLLAGKLIGLGALTFVQYTLWILIAILVLVATRQDITAFLDQLNLSLGEMVYIALYALGGYLLYSALMAGLGALAPNLKAANSLTFILVMPMVVPFFFWTAIVGAPHSTLAIVLSLFPFSAPLGMLLRLTTTSVPAWQIAASLVLLALTSVAIIWLMARLFRVQTLLSGEALSLRRFWSALSTG
jgi:ABC-2 type transport system permease protein